MSQALATRYTQSVKTSSHLSKLPIIGREQSVDVRRLTPAEVIPLIREASIDFVLVGAHGISGWLLQARATEDVDLLIRTRDRKKATRKILEYFPELIPETLHEVIRLKRGKDCLIDLMLTHNPFYKRVFNEFIEINLDGLSVKVPKLEAALAMKFSAMTGHYRSSEKKYYDAGDFSSMIKKTAKINLALLSELGELVYAGGGAELAGYVEDVRAGRRMEI